MKIQYLGTAAAEGIPGVFCRCETCRRAFAAGGKNIRTRSQALIDGKLLIDLPPDTYYHALRFHLELGAVESLIVTHSHQDHFYPLELILRGYPYAHKQEGRLTVYGNSNVKRLYEIALAEENDTPNLPEAVTFRKITELQPFETREGYRITPLPAVHKENERCFVYLIEKDGKRIFYGNDSGFYHEKVWEYLKGTPLDLISLDCTAVRKSGGGGHMGIQENVAAYARFREIGCVHENTRVVVNHFSHNGGALHEELEELVKPYGFLVSYDGLEVEI